MQCINYTNNLPDGDLTKSKYVVEETDIIHDNLAHNQSRNTRTCTSKTGATN